MQIRTHFRYAFLDLVSIVTFQPDLVNVWKVKPEVMVILEIQAEGAQLRLGSVPHSSAAVWPWQLSSTLVSWYDWFSQLHRLLGREMVKSLLP